MKTVLNDKKNANERMLRRISLTSKAFAPYRFIPARYTCDGEDINPPLDLTGVPASAKSLLLTVEDLDGRGSTILHWMVFNIPIVTHFAEDDIPGDQALSDFGSCNYTGPCATGTHRYLFKILALDIVLPLAEGTLPLQVYDLITDHILAQGELIGLYKKEPITKRSK